MPQHFLSLEFWEHKSLPPREGRSGWCARGRKQSHMLDVILADENPILWFGSDLLIGLEEIYVALLVWEPLDNCPKVFWKLI